MSCALRASPDRFIGLLAFDNDGSAIGNVASQEFHQAVGLIPTERVVFFSKELL